MPIFKIFIGIERTLHLVTSLLWRIHEVHKASSLIGHPSVETDYHARRVARAGMDDEETSVIDTWEQKRTPVTQSDLTGKCCKRCRASVVAFSYSWIWEHVGGG
ncbi:hypothetical protein E3N88_03514 [Mikania micrantha]|uniref:Uncharacterized protein n=1 Tax=Mikania micrantha TaxID=192012 RepID=A0A5N6Q931_9ASTR|nr:hypothetical protein E3N88_03514 [Mikania micrantha]